MTTCRICRDDESEEKLIHTQCSCKGSMRFVHQSCQQEWIRSSGQRTCGVCKKSSFDWWTIWEIAIFHWCIMMFHRHVVDFLPSFVYLTFYLLYRPVPHVYILIFLSAMFICFNSIRDICIYLFCSLLIRFLNTE